MNNRRLLSSTVLYGVANVAVMAVGGFVLLPLYTRTLSQGEFGMYVTIRANIDLLTYLLQFGLPSAVGRAYFDYKRTGQQYEYLNSVIGLFLLVLGAYGGLLWLWGETLWAWLSPSTPAHPYLAFSVAIAAVGFPAALVTLWLRLEDRVMAVVGVQIASAVVLAVLAVVSLALLHLGLNGLLMALLISSVVSAAALPWLFEGRFRLTIDREHVTASLRYAVPILVGYIAYFVLNRFSTVVLQRHVSVEQVGVYGLAQQLALIVGIASMSFGMALQPRVFAADQAQATQVLAHAARLLVLLMMGVTSGLILFAPELLALTGPAQYRSAFPILLVLLLANFTNTFTLISDTALLYWRRPKTSVAISLLGAAVTALLSMYLIPQYELQGAAWAMAGGLTARMLLSQWAAQSLGYCAWPALLGSLLTLAGLALSMIQLQDGPGASSTATVLKLLAVAVTSTVFYAVYKNRQSRRCAS